MSTVQGTHILRRAQRCKLPPMPTFTLRINGRTHEIEGDPDDNLLAVLRYDLDLAAYGVPGLTLMGRYITGRGGKGSVIDPSSPYAKLGFQDGQRHWERDLELRYVVQSGKAKNLAFRLVYAMTRGNSAEPRGDMNEVRIITQYPFKVF